LNVVAKRFGIKGANFYKPEKLVRTILEKQKEQANAVQKQGPGKMGVRQQAAYGEEVGEAHEVDQGAAQTGLPQEEVQMKPSAQGAAQVPPVSPRPEAKQPWEMTRDEYLDSNTYTPTEGPSLVVKNEGGEIEHVTYAEAFDRGLISKKQYDNRFGGLNEKQATRSGAIAHHHNAVFRALSEGKPVPPEVLADYPDLAAKQGKVEAAKPATRKQLEQDAKELGIKVKKEWSKAELEAAVQEARKKARQVTERQPSSTQLRPVEEIKFEPEAQFTSEVRNELGGLRIRIKHAANNRIDAMSRVDEIKDEIEKRAEVQRAIKDTQARITGKGMRDRREVARREVVDAFAKKDAKYIAARQKWINAQQEVYDLEERVSALEKDAIDKARQTDEENLRWYEDELRKYPWWELERFLRSSELPRHEESRINSQRLAVERILAEKDAALNEKFSRITRGAVEGEILPESYEPGKGMPEPLLTEEERAYAAQIKAKSRLPSKEVQKGFTKRDRQYFVDKLQEELDKLNAGIISEDSEATVFVDLPDDGEFNIRRTRIAIEGLLRRLGKKPKGLKDTPTGQTELTERIGAPGGTAERLAGGERPNIDYSPVEPPGPLPGIQLRPIESPELLELAREITSDVGVAPRLRKSLGMFYSGPERIGLNPEVAKDPVQMADTLAHEIGHASDLSSSLEKTLKRGNILGRVASLKEYLKHTLEYAPGSEPALTAQDRKDMMKQARAIAGKGAGKNEIREIYRQLVQEEIDARRLWVRDDIHQELIELSRWWKPYERGNVTDGYTRYRESGREIFADAVSVLLRAPRELKNRAPKFWKALGNYMDRKPEFKDALLRVAEIISGTPEQVAEHRSRIIRQVFDTGDEQVLAADAARNDYRKGFFNRIIQDLELLVFDKATTAKKAAKQAVQHRDVSDESNPLYILDEFNHRGTPLWTLMKDVRDKVMSPMEQAGLTQHEVAEFVYANRILGDRGDKLNPAAWTPQVAQSQLEHLRARMGETKWNVLNKAISTLHDEILRPILEDGLKHGVINDKIYKEKIEPNIGRYATFLVAKYYDGHVAGTIKKQIGTFSDIADPFNATIMKAVAMRRLIEINKTAAAIRDVMLELGDGRSVDVPYGRSEPKGSPADGRDWLRVMENGKLKFYDVPSNAVDALKAHDTGRLGEVGTMLHSPTYGLFHALYVRYSPSFIARNLPRDLRRTYVNLGAKYGISARELFGALRAAHSHAKSYASGEYDALVTQMMKERAINIPHVRVESDLSERQWVKRELQKLSLDPNAQKPSRHAAVRASKRLLGVIEYAGTYQEALTKIAAYKLLSERGVPTHERAYNIRKLVGTPDTGQRGLLNPITNTLWMYSKVRLNGLAADAGLAFGKQTAGGWWLRAMGTTVPFRVIAWAARYGLLGALAKAIYDRIPDHYLSDASIIPIGWVTDKFGNWKALFVSIPEDDLSSMFANAVWRMLNAATGDEKEQLSKLAQALWQQVPSVNPAVNLIWKWSQFALGKNPTDDYFGGNIIPDTEYQAGGWPAAQRMLTWTMNQTGAVKIVAKTFWPSKQVQSIEASEPTTFESVLGRIPGLSSILHVSDRGISESEWDTIMHDDAERARLRLKLPDVARRASRDRWILNRKGKDNLNEVEKANRLKLNNWYNRYYLPLTGRIKVAEEKGNSSEANRLRNQLKADTENVLFSPR
jgi:hypothetical protein